MDYARFVQLRRPIWDRFEGGLETAAASLRSLSHQQVAEAIGSPSAAAARMTVVRAVERLAAALDESAHG